MPCSGSPYCEGRSHRDMQIKLLTVIYNYDCIPEVIVETTIQEKEGEKEGEKETTELHSCPEYITYTVYRKQGLSRSWRSLGFRSEVSQGEILISANCSGR